MESEALSSVAKCKGVPQNAAIKINHIRCNILKNTLKTGIGCTFSLLLKALKWLRRAPALGNSSF